MRCGHCRLYLSFFKRDEWGDAFKPGSPVFVFARRMFVEGFEEAKDGGVVDDVSDEPTVADGTADFCVEDEPLDVVDVVGAIEEGTDFFGEGIEGCLGYGGWLSRCRRGW